jgi:MFS family permease
MSGSTLKINPYLLYMLSAFFLIYEVMLQVFPGIITQQLMIDLNTNAFGLSLISASYFYLYSFLQIPAGLLFDRFPIRYVMTLPLSVCILGVILFSIAHSAWLAASARLMMGIGSSFAFIGVLTIAGDLFSHQKFPLLTGITQMLCASGAILGGYPLLVLINSFGWRLALLIISLFGFSFLPLFWKYINYSKPQISIQPAQFQFFPILTQIIKHHQLRWISLYACLSWAPIPVFAALWGVPFLSSTYHLTQTTAAFLNTLVWAGYAIGSPLLGILSIGINRRTPILIISSFLALATSTIILSANNISLFTLSMLLLLMGIACGGQGLCFSLVKENVRREIIAGSIGFNNMVVVLFGAVFQTISGKLIELHSHFTGVVALNYNSSDYQIGLLILPVFSCLSLIISYFLIQETYCGKENINFKSPTTKVSAFA